MIGPTVPAEAGRSMYFGYKDNGERGLVARSRCALQ